MGLGSEQAVGQQLPLGKLQERFARLLPRLIDHIHSLGYEIRLGDLFRDPRSHGALDEQGVYGHPRSCHKLKLAIDINLFRNGEYLEGTQADIAHGQLHDWWELHGGAKRIKGDLNHYSLQYQDMR